MENAQKKRDDDYKKLGQMAWLWMNSPLHREWSTHLMTKFLLRAIELDQCIVLERDGMPVAYCSWAWFDANSEAGYILDASTLSMEAWNSGKRLWFIDWIAPFGKQDSLEMRSLLAEKFKGQVARALRVKKGISRGRIMEFKGKDLPVAAARQQLNQSYYDFLRTAQAMNLVRAQAAETA